MQACLPNGNWVTLQDEGRGIYHYRDPGSGRLCEWGISGGPSMESAVDALAGARRIKPLGPGDFRPCGARMNSGR